MAVAPARGEIGEQLARFSYRAPESSGRVQSISATRSLSNSINTPDPWLKANSQTEASRQAVRAEACLRLFCCSLFLKEPTNEPIA